MVNGENKVFSTHGKEDITMVVKSRCAYNMMREQKVDTLKVVNE